MEEIEGLTSVSGHQATDSQQSLAEVTQRLYEARLELEAQENFKSVASEALGRALERPGAVYGVQLERAAFMSGSDGDVGGLKNEVLSDVNQPESRLEQSGETMEDRFVDLWENLTAYQVAWRVAQKIPQDLSQILKGG